LYGLDFKFCTYYPTNANRAFVWLV